MYSIPLADTTVSFITPCLTLFMLLFSAIMIYRFVSDDESGRRSILYLNNVTTGSYYLSLLIFYSVMMVIIGLICGIAVYFCNIVSNTLLLYMFGYFILAGLAVTSFSLFIGILVNQKYEILYWIRIISRIFGIIICMGLNIAGFLLVDQETMLDLPILANVLPGF